MRSPRRGASAGWLALALLLAGCAGASGTAGGVELRVVIPDGNIRAEGAECDGARPYREVHTGVPFTVEGDDGTVLVEGALPTGMAENADPSIDWEDLERIPTVCVMELVLGELPEHPAYVLRIDGVDPLDFGAADVAVGTPIVLVVG